MSVLETARVVLTMAEALKNVDLIEKIRGLQQEAARQDEELSSLKEEKRELEAKLQFSGTLQLKNSLYYAEGYDAPICTNCWDGDRKCMHLTLDQHHATYRCHRCKAIYPNPECPPGRPSTGSPRHGGYV